MYRKSLDADRGNSGLCLAAVILRVDDAIGATLVGIGLVPIFTQFDAIYAAHGAMTAAVTPPLVVTLIFSVFW